MNDKTNPMTLTINRENAQRMINASKRYNERLNIVKKEEEVDNVDGLLIRIGHECGDEFVNVLMKNIKEKGPEEIKVCCSLFLDMSKSSKLMMAFEILGVKDNHADDGGLESMNVEVQDVAPEKKDEMMNVDIKIETDDGEINRISENDDIKIEEKKNIGKDEDSKVKMLTRT